MPVKSDRNDARGDRAADAAWMVSAGALQIPGAQETRAMLGQAPLTVCQLRAGSGETGPTPDCDDLSQKQARQRDRRGQTSAADSSTSFLHISETDCMAGHIGLEL
jgi:hypothetical protein